MEGHENCLESIRINSKIRSKDIAVALLEQLKDLPILKPGISVTGYGLAWFHWVLPTVELHFEPKPVMGRVDYDWCFVDGQERILILGDAVLPGLVKKLLLEYFSVEPLG